MLKVSTHKQLATTVPDSYCLLRCQKPINFAIHCTAYMSESQLFIKNGSLPKTFYIQGTFTKAVEGLGTI